MMDMEGIEKIDQIDVEVVEDKTLLYQDFMYKLILLGSSGILKYRTIYIYIYIYRRGKDEYSDEGNTGHFYRGTSCYTGC